MFGKVSKTVASVITDLITLLGFVVSFWQLDGAALTITTFVIGLLRLILGGAAVYAVPNKEPAVAEDTSTQEPFLKIGNI